ncbi:hypothetical protein ACWD4G_20945 [Streptomyces sp. NPDC002643]
MKLCRAVRDEIDAHILRDARIAAIRAVVDAGRDRGDVGVGTAQFIVADRYAHHGDRIARVPESPLDLESLASRVGGCPARAVAIEAVWDGDTVHDWFVRLPAITAGPADEHTPATLGTSTARSHLGEDAALDGRHPSAVAAERVGRALAARLSLPFHFASPDIPDDEAPRRQPTASDENGRGT